MIKQLVDLYKSGIITGYQLMIDCLHRLDPAHPELVLGELPAEVLDKILAYARRYDPSRPSLKNLPLPAEDQIRAAEGWINGRVTAGA